MQSSPSFSPRDRSTYDFSDQHSPRSQLSAVHKPYAFDSSSMLSSVDQFDLKGVPMDLSRPSPVYPPTSDTPLPSNDKWWQNVLPDSLSCKIYLLVVLIETAIDLAIEADLLIRIDAAQGTDNAQLSNTSRKMPVYLVIFSLAHVWQFLLAFDAVYARNTLQFVALALFNALFLAYAIIQSSEVRDSLRNVSDQNGFSHIPVNTLFTILPIVIAIAELVYIGLGYKIYKEFGWKVYKFLGADRQIKRMFAHYQIFQCLVKFDLFFWVGFCVQFVGLILQKNDWEYYVTIIALPLSIILVVEGYLAARYENKWMMISFLTGCAGGLVYFSYKFIKVLVKRNDKDYKPVYDSLTTFSFISIVLLVITIAYACLIWRNFGRGLKEHISKNQSGLGRSKHSAYPSVSVRPNRMSFE